MRTQILHLFAIILTAKSVFAEELPLWAKSGETKTSNGVNIVCSGEDSDPEVANSKATNNCLASAMKLSGVNIKNSERVYSNLEKTNYEGHIETDELQGVVKCDFTKRYLQIVDNKTRIWLQCHVPNKNILSFNAKKINGEVLYGPKKIFDELESTKSENQNLNEQLKNTEHEISEVKKELENSRAALQRTIEKQNATINAYEKKLNTVSNEKQYFSEQYYRLSSNNPIDQSYNDISNREKIIENSSYRGMPIKVLEKLFKDVIHVTINGESKCYRQFRTFKMSYVGKLDLCLGGDYGNFIVLGYCKHRGSCYESR